jgi:Lrp/AsnC family transcriptional regulator, regulator for asnA, asnC and gidA
MMRTEPDPATAATTRDAPQLDDITRTLIEMLQRDGRRSYASMAKTVGLSEAAVRQRVQRLVEAQVLQIVAVTDPTQVGFSRQAMIGVRVDGDPTEPLDALDALPEVEYIVITAGSFDLLLEVVCEDDDHLLDLIRRIRRVPGVTTTESFLYLKLLRQRYDWGTR